MGIWKGFLAVLASYAALALVKIYSASLLLNSSFLGYANLVGPPFYGASVIIVIPILILGVILWLGRTFIANQLSQRIFRAKAGFREELGDFGFAHFPLIFVGLSSMIIFIFGLSNIGIFASLFLGMFFSLLMYAYFVSAVMANNKLNWKKALLIIAITETIIAAVMFLAGLITLHPFMQNSLMSMMTI